MSVFIDDSVNKLEFKYDKVPSTVYDDSIILANRTPVHHGNLSPPFYMFIFQLFMIKMFGPYFWKTTLSVFGSLVVYYFFGLIFALATIVGACTILIIEYNSFKDMMGGVLRSRFLPHIFHSNPMLKETNYYKDKGLLWTLWSISPYRLTFLKNAMYLNKITKEQYNQTINNRDSLVNSLHSFVDFNNTTTGNTNIIEKSTDDVISNTFSSPFLPSPSTNVVVSGPIIPQDRPENITIYQPSEGFCAPATINTIIASVPQATLSPFTLLPVPLSLHELSDIISPTSTVLHRIHLSSETKTKFKDVSINYTSSNTQASYKKFLTQISQANDPKYRVMVNFLRAPMFNSRPNGVIKKAVAMFAGHWCPIASIIIGNRTTINEHVEMGSGTDTGYALILDVNNTYGPFCMTLEDLFYSCYTKDGDTYRGLAVIELAD